MKIAIGIEEIRDFMKRLKSVRDIKKIALKLINNNWYLVYCDGKLFFLKRINNMEVIDNDDYNLIILDTVSINKILNKFSQDIVLNIDFDSNYVAHIIGEEVFVKNEINISKSGRINIPYNIEDRFGLYSKVGEELVQVSGEMWSREELDILFSIPVSKDLYSSHRIFTSSMSFIVTAAVNKSNKFVISNVYLKILKDILDGVENAYFDVIGQKIIKVTDGNIGCLVPLSSPVAMTVNTVNMFESKNYDISILIGTQFLKSSISDSDNSKIVINTNKFMVIGDDGSEDEFSILKSKGIDGEISFNIRNKILRDVFDNIQNDFVAFDLHFGDNTILIRVRCIEDDGKTVIYTYYFTA